MVIVMISTEDYESYCIKSNSSDLHCFHAATNVLATCLVSLEFLHVG